MTTLYNVIDVRTKRFHSIAVVSAKNLRYFVPAEPVEEEPKEEAEEE